ncbi:MAG: M23 family metallopeptidase, partial [Methanospirillum sp.]|nr:M23 family metallopeptidase [Methanospirillum sp.]
FLAGSTPISADQVPEQPVVNMTCPVPPVPVVSPGGVNIAYELNLEIPNTTATLIPESIEVIDEDTGKTLYIPDPEVFAQSYQPAAIPPPTTEKLMNGTKKLTTPRISIWFKVDPDAVPDRLIHRLTINQSAGGLPSRSVTGGEVTVRNDLKPVVLGSPVKGPGWVVMETTEPTTHHFLFPVTKDNITTVDQRYAQDLFYIDPVTGQAAEGDITRPESILSYGKELLAARDGTVVDVRDGVPDNDNFNLPPISFETGTGNYVIIDIGDGKYVCYLHIIPGSIRVKSGDTVKEGQVIGLLGNSGQSEIAHLHMEVVTGKPSIIGGEGYPYVFRSYNQIAELNKTALDEKFSNPDYSNKQYYSEFGNYVIFFPEPKPLENKIQENWDIVSFP